MTLKLDLRSHASRDIPFKQGGPRRTHTKISPLVGDFSRFEKPRQLMAYLGLVPSEHSSGATVRKGGITKAGNALARRVLIEGAWTYRMPARVSPKLHARLEAVPKAVRDIAWKAQVRLCNRYRRLAASGKAKAVVNHTG
jgi:transposase